MSFKLADYDYDLPPERIAIQPANPKESAKVLVVEKEKRSYTENVVSDFQDLFSKDSLLVINNTKVIPARLKLFRKTGAELELLLLKREAENEWSCKIKNSRKLKLDENISTKTGSAKFKYLGTDENGTSRIETSFGFEEMIDFLELEGSVPIPPYILKQREKEMENIPNDRANYQTSFAKEYGSAAAPTAGLHFTENLLQQIKNKGIELVEITLHVGLGTFSKIDVEDIRDYKIHTETAYVSEDAALKINSARIRGKKIIAVGTTSIRTLEGFWDGEQVAHGSREIDLYIYPPYKFQVVDEIVTNFHLPKSSLLMLVSAFCGRDKILDAYKYAKERGFRFFSYGDCMYLK